MFSLRYGASLGVSDMLTHAPNRQTGLTLTELLIGLVVGLIVLGGVIAIYLATFRGSTDVLRSARLNQELRAVTDIMSGDIRRAGYWAGAVGGGMTNPFMDRTAGTATDIHILDTGSCVLYSYDATYLAGNTVGTVDAADRFGFRLTNGAIMMRSSGATADDCSDGTWEAVTDSKSVTIDSLTFSFAGSKCLNTNTSGAWTANAASTTPVCADNTASGYTAPTAGDNLVEIRQLTISVTAHHVDDASVKIEFDESVKLRNNRIVVAP